MPVAEVFVTALADHRIKTATEYHVLFAVGEHSDEVGNPQPDADGTLITDPKILAAKLGVTKTSIYKAFASLQTLGYIDWVKAGGSARSRGISGSVRIIVPSSRS